MNGLIALLGSGEYLPVMDDVDRYLLANSGSKNGKPRVVCLPTAAGQEGDASIGRWSKMGFDHFQRLGADVQAVPVIDSESANDPQWESAVENADLIYFSGGNPGYLYQTMKGSRVWVAAQKAWTRGAVYAGCSAGAMILSQQMPGFRMPGQQSQNAFGILPIKFTIPHFDAIPGMWKPLIFTLRRALKAGEIILGVDENTALIGTLRVGGEWKVMGASKVHLFTRAGEQVYKDGETLSLPE
jgi:cyanophycinase-like exopeptidase